MKVITLWLAVDPSNLENGCMRVISGSHRDVARSMDEYEPVDKTKNVFNARLKPELIDESRSVDLELAVGECHFHDAWTIHGSNPNPSPHRRCGYTMRYMPADVVFRQGEWARAHHVYLLRGEDRTGGQTVYTPVPEFD
jgi:ectoine hydroxylase-related dioxygenase (phytanoyl-CoA dioxygenase family)